jgi:hypothetical protein
MNTTVLIGILAAIEIGLISTAGYFLSQLVGNKDTTNDLSKTVTTITSILGAIVMFHTALWYVYFMYNPLSMNIYFLITTSLTMVLSLTSLAVSIVNRQ